MKNKKSLFGLGLLALILVLGVGYAVVNSVGLNITGSATAKTETIDVSFKSVSDAGATVKHTLTDGAIADEFTIENMELNKAVVMTYTIQNNESDVKANITGVEVTGNTNYFTASYVINDSQIAAKGTGTVTVTVTMTKTPVDATNATADFTIALTATPAE